VSYSPNIIGDLFTGFAGVEAMQDIGASVQGKRLPTERIMAHFRGLLYLESLA